MLTALPYLLCVLVRLLFARFLLLVIIDNLALFVLAMLILFKWTFSATIGFVRYLFRPKDTESLA